MSDARNTWPLAVLLAATVSLLAGIPIWCHANTQANRGNIVTMQDDLAARSHDIHWPQDFDPAKADLFAHNELAMNASCERIWQHIIDVGKWPQWYPNSKDVALLNGVTALGESVVWRWNTFGFSIESRMNEFVPFTRIGWFGYAPGTEPSFYHTWYLVPEGKGCRVVTEEVGMGPAAVHLLQTNESLMHRGHDLWLATLKWIAESR
jgi:hypothetical protein